MVIVEIAAGYEGIEKSGGEKAKQQLGWLLLYSDWSLLILRREGERERKRERERERSSPSGSCERARGVFLLFSQSGDCPRPRQFARSLGDHNAVVEHPHAYRLPFGSVVSRRWDVPEQRSPKKVRHSLPLLVFRCNCRVSVSQCDPFRGSPRDRLEEHWSNMQRSAKQIHKY